MKTSCSALATGLLFLFLATSVAPMESGRITGSVYCDHNKNHQFDKTEKGLENIHVQIFVKQCSGPALQTVHTDFEGKFVFEGFGPDTYYIRSDVACVCGGRMPTTNTCQKVILEEGMTIDLPPFGYTEYGQ